MSSYSRMAQKVSDEQQECRWWFILGNKMQQKPYLLLTLFFLWQMETRRMVKSKEILLHSEHQTPKIHWSLIHGRSSHYYPSIYISLQVVVWRKNEDDVSFFYADDMHCKNTMESIKEYITSKKSDHELCPAMSKQVDCMSMYNIHTSQKWPRTLIHAPTEQKSGEQQNMWWWVKK